MTKAATSWPATTASSASLRMPTVASLPVGTVNTAYSQTFTTTSGGANCNYQVIAGTLPAGLLLLALVRGD